MSASFNRDNLAWLVVRAFGAYFVLSIALDLVPLVLTILSMAKIYILTADTSAKSDTVSYVMDANWARVQSFSIQVVLNAVFAYYCFYHGKWIHRLLIFRLPKQSINDISSLD